MSSTTMPRPDADGAVRIKSLVCVAVPVTDIEVARTFYARVLGLEDKGSDLLPGFERHAVLATPSGQFVVLAHAQGPDTRETGVHTAFRVGPAARETIAARLAKEGVQVHTYAEDRAKEEGDNFYLHDRDGNRIQLVRARAARSANGVEAIDHTTVLSFDMVWSEAYYRDYLGFEVESRFGVRTADHARAAIWADGKEHMAPGTRRLDKLYMTMGGRNEVARTNMQVYYRAGDAVFGVYLATKHLQEPPEEQIIGGAPRTTFLVERAELDRIARILEQRKRPSSGPVAHPASAPYAASLYCKDPSGNFLEFCAMR